MPRLVATIKKANTELGGNDSKNNFFIFRRAPEIQENDYSYLAGIVYKKDGISELEQELLKTETNYLKLETIYDMKSNPEGIYQDIIQSDNLKVTLDKFPQILTPATDDNPYFEHVTKFSSINPGLIKESFSRTKDNAQYAFVQKPVAESTLIVLLIQAAILSILLILIPILIKFKKVANLAGVKKGKYLLYFSLLGLGYIMIEICLIQKFTLFLGQPVYTMLTVISTMLVFSGIGSLFSDKIIRKLGNNIIYVFIIISAFVILIGFINPILFQLLDRADILFRILISIAVIAPLSFFMGIPFPFGIKQIPSIVSTKDTAGELDVNRYLTAYSWGINGFFSVIGSILVVMLSMSWGFKVVFVIAGILYLGAMLTSRKMTVKE